MMTSYFNLLKYAQTGIASPDMTYYDKARASTLMGGAVQTLTGIPPLSFKADGSPLISWSMKGNGSQSGTPTPDNPVMPEFVGVRTANLFDKNSDTTNNNGYTRPGVEVPAGTYSIDNRTPHHVYYRIGYSGAAQQTNPGAKTQRIVASDNLYVWRDAGIREDGVMLNSGSTALPFEPFGYKIPITCAGQTTTVYLGQVSTVRKIHKLVLNGDESCYQYDFQSTKGVGVLNVLDANHTRAAGFCSHYPVSRATELNSLWIGVSNKALYFIGIMDVLGISSTADFKSYLAAQYAAGTPVTVWYVLATPETGIVNEPLCKIGDYADELHSTDAAVTIPTVKDENVLTVETELQPSEMTITYKG